MAQFNAWRRRPVPAVVYCLLLPGAASIFGGPIQYVEQRAFLHQDSGLLAEFDRGSSTYTSHLDPEGLGTFTWTHTNRTLSAQTGLRFLAFLDADIDRDVNTFFNEHGDLISLGRPPGAPAGAITASGWEIDEPGFVFGDIYAHLLSGELDNTNAVPVGAPDDVSLALAFRVGTLSPNASITATFIISRTNIDGLVQTDPSSQVSFYFNGYVTPDTPSDPAVPAVPEPSAFLFSMGGLAALYLFRRK